MPLMKCQRGFSLLELIVVMALMTLIGVWGANQWAQSLEDGAADATATWMLGLQGGLVPFLAHRVDLLTGLSEPAKGAGLANPNMPTIREMRQAGWLPPGFAERPPHSGGFGLMVLPSAGCPDGTCRAEAIAWSMPPSSRQGSDVYRSGRMLSALGGKGMVVSPLNPGRIKGPLADLPNPPVPGQQPWPVGTVAVLSHFAIMADDRHVRRMDPRQTHLRGGLVTDAGLRAASIQSGGSIASAGRLTAGEYLKIQGKGRDGQGCPEDGLIARGETGGLLVCEQGAWRGQDSPFGGAYAISSYDNCGRLSWATLPWWRRGRVSTVNPRTGDCSCPPGYQAVKVSAGGDIAGPHYWTTGFVCMRG